MILSACCNSNSQTLIVFTHTPIATTQDCGGVGQIATPTNVNGSWSGAVADTQIIDAAFMVDSWSGATGANGDNLDLTNLKLLVPSYATILGVTVQISRKGSATTVLSDKTVQLLISGSPSGSNKASGTTYGTSVATATYGGSADLWGLTIAPADIMDSGFGVRFQPQTSSGGAVTVSVDRVFIIVRYTVPATAHITRVDGTTFQPIWGYNLGQTVISQEYHPNPPLIDADGNIYVSSRGESDATPGSRRDDLRLDALDVDGNLLWTWAGGNVTTPDSAPLTGAFNPSCFDSSGNIIVCHRLTIAGNYFLSVIDPSGSVVFQIAYPSGSIPAGLDFSTIGPQGVNIDSFGNIYVLCNATANVSVNILKFDSSGTYISNTASVSFRAMTIDAVVDKLYGFAQVNSTPGGSNSATIISKLDCSTMTADWTKSFQDIDAGVSATSTPRAALPFQIGMDSSGHPIAGAVFANGTTNRYGAYAVDGTGTPVFVLMPIPPGIAAPTNSGYHSQWSTADYASGDVYLVFALGLLGVVGFKTSNVGGGYHSVFSMQLNTGISRPTYSGIGARTI